MMGEIGCHLVVLSRADKLKYAEHMYFLIQVTGIRLNFHSFKPVGGKCETISLILEGIRRCTE